MGTIKEQILRVQLQHNESFGSSLPFHANEGLKRSARTQRKCFPVLVALMGLVTFCMWFLSWIYNHIPSDNERYRVGDRNPAYLIEAEHGAVAAENKRCSDIGVRILQDGGNAVDAAIGATFCTGIVNMFS